MSVRSDIPQAFAGPIEDRLRRLTHLGRASASDSAKISVNADGMELTVVLDGETETISDACFEAPADAPEAAVLDLLCDHAIGAPVREMAEHGLIYALQALRNPDMPAPVSGILTPRNAAACFATPLRLVSAIRREIEAKSGRHTDTNFFDQPYSEAWRKLDKTGKRDLVLPHITVFKADNGLSDSAFELVEIDQYDRLFLAFTDEIAAWHKPVLLMRLERWLREQTGERIELFTEVVKDANRIRRL